jgi:RHS repeat-associated protein
VAERRTTPTGSTTVFAILSDGLGSTVVAQALDGSATHSLAYSPYGLVRPRDDPDTAPDITADGAARFVGRRPDAELDVVVFGDRPYSPRLGRFLTPDWFVIERPERATGHPIALNVYAYAGNNPTTFRDPSGRFLITALVAIGAAFVVGFAAGAIVGAASGKSFGESLLMGLETGLLFSAGMALGAVTGGLAGGLLFGAGGILVGAIVGGTIGGLNGLIGGLTQNYSLDGLGALSFLLDSTWGLIGTGLGLLFHGINLFYGSDADYNWQLSRRQNRHVYDGGFSFGEGYATTQGNVISNLDGSHGELLEHEMLHVWQSRGFGPIYQTVYVGWIVVGGVVGAIVGIGTAIAGTQSWGDTVKDFAYHNNPWEIWAYYQEGPGTAEPGGKGDFSLV